MFRSDQIFTATNVVKSFSKLGKRLDFEPQALLITQKAGENLVLVNATIFEELLYKQMQRDSADVFVEYEDNDFKF